MKILGPGFHHVFRNMAPEVLSFTENKSSTLYEKSRIKQFYWKYVYLHPLLPTQWFVSVSEFPFSCSIKSLPFATIQQELYPADSNDDILL